MFVIYISDETLNWLPKIEQFMMTMNYEIKYLILKEIFWKDRENLFLKLHTKNGIMLDMNIEQR